MSWQDILKAPFDTQERNQQILENFHIELEKKLKESLDDLWTEALKLPKNAYETRFDFDVPTVDHNKFINLAGGTKGLIDALVELYNVKDVNFGEAFLPDSNGRSGLRDWSKVNYSIDKK